MVYPNIMPASVFAESMAAGGDTPKPRLPRVEYLATLSRHSAAVNVVRFSPNGECGLEFMRRSGVGWHEELNENEPSLTSAMSPRMRDPLLENNASRVTVQFFHLYCR